MSKIDFPLNAPISLLMALASEARMVEGQL
jgi:hypothetical protein